MNAKLTILILVAMIAAVLVPVSAENVYVDRNPALYDAKPLAAYGYVVFYIRAGGSAQDLNIWIGNDANKDAKFDAAYHPDKTPIEGQNPHFLKVKVLMDGVSEPVMLAAGDYTAYLQKGNGDQLEQFKFKIGGGATERVQFLGAAVSCPGEMKCKPVYKIIRATYGTTECDTIHHDAETHEEFVVDGQYHVYAYKLFYENHHFVMKVKCTNHADHGEGWHIETPACTEEYGHYITVVDVPAYDEQVCSEVIDVTGEVQGVVNGGNLQFIFDNRPSPGGIFAADGTTLLTEITDPAPGFLKQVTVLYTDGCGNERSILVSEYDLIDLTASA